MIKLLGILLLAISAHAQAIYIGGGLTASPYTAGNVTLGICTRDGVTCQITNFEGKGTLEELKTRQLHYTTSVGVRQVMTSVTSEKFKVDLFMVGQGGTAITTTATGFSGAMGGGLTFHPVKSPNWSWTVMAHGNYSNMNPGWQPYIAAQVGYTFRSVVTKKQKEPKPPTFNAPTVLLPPVNGN